MSEIRDWVLFIFRVNSRLERLCRKADRYIENTALCVGSNAKEAFEVISREIGNKIELINLRVMFEAMAARLDAAQRTILRGLSKGITSSDLAKKLGVSKSTIKRKAALAIEKCELTLFDLGYDERKLKKEYGARRE